MAAIAKTALPQLYSLRTLSEAGYGSIATLRRAIREGRLDAVRVGGRLKVTAEALARYIGEPIVVSEPEPIVEPEPVVEPAPASSTSFIDDAEMPTAQIRRVRRVKPAEWGMPEPAAPVSQPAPVTQMSAPPTTPTPFEQSAPAMPSVVSQAQVPAPLQTPAAAAPLPGGLERGNLPEEGSPARAGGQQEAPQAVELGQAPQEAQRGYRLTRARNR